MLLSKLIPLAAALQLASAYANLALRFDALMKRDNSTIVPSTEAIASSTALTTEIGTAIATTDSNGQPTTIYTTTTIVYYSTIQNEDAAVVGYTPTESVSTYGDPTSTSSDVDTTITSFIVTTVTLAGNTVESTLGTTTETVATSGLNLGQKYGVSAGAYSTAASVTGVIDAAEVDASEAASSGICEPTTVTVTVTATPDDCYGTSLSTGVVKVALTASFTFTGSDGEIFTTEATTEVEQTTTEVVYLTSTIDPTSTYSNASWTTTSLASTTTDAFYGNGTSAANLAARAFTEEIYGSDLTALELIKRFFSFF